MVIMLGKAAKSLFFGKLRDIEIEASHPSLSYFDGSSSKSAPPHHPPLTLTAHVRSLMDSAGGDVHRHDNFPGRV